jgi:hypothetical protein
MGLVRTLNPHFAPTLTGDVARFQISAPETKNLKVSLTVLEKRRWQRDGARDLEFLELEMFKSGGVRGFIVGRQANTGESKGQGQATMKSRQIEIYKIWQKVDENMEISPSVLTGVFLRPSKPFESTGERGEDEGENMEGCIVDVVSTRGQHAAHV